MTVARPVGLAGHSPFTDHIPFARRPRHAPRVLVSDKLSPTAVQIFKDRGVEVDYLPDLGKDKDKLLEVIGQYDGLAIRSATKVTEKLITAATKLKVDRPRRHRRRQCRHPGGDRARASS